MVERHMPYWPRCLSEQMAATYCGVSLPTFHKVIDDHVKPVQISQGRKVYLRDQVDAWLDRQAGIIRTDEQPKTEDDDLKAIWDA